MSQFCNVEFAKMTDIIKHRGIVENIEGSHVRVRIVQTSACSACSVKGHCNASESKEKLIDVFDMKASSYRIGEEVMIYGTTSMGMQAVLLAFGIPFLVLLITLFISMRLTLTFDAGFENGNTEKILDALKKHNVKATFFLVGNYIETSPELVERMVEEGHTIGNHTYSHPDMSKISDEESFKKELQSLESLYKETTGQELLKIYRPPQGKYCVSNLEMADKLGYKTIFWSLAYVDWYENKQPTKEEAFNKLLKRIHPGAIVLLHSTSKTNGDILDELLTKWEDMGYSFGEIKDLIS